MPATFRVVGGRELAAHMLFLDAEVSGAMAVETQTAARQLQAQVRANASTGFHGRGEPHIPGTGPGPNVVTGDYVRSIQVAQEATVLAGRGVTASAVVYTDAPQADRLEYGFHGIDVLGRHYRQQPYPHWAPAVDVVERTYLASAEAVVNGAIERIR